MINFRRPIVLENRDSDEDIVLVDFETENSDSDSETADDDLESSQNESLSSSLATAGKCAVAFWVPLDEDTCDEEHDEILSRPIPRFNGQQRRRIASLKRKPVAFWVPLDQGDQKSKEFEMLPIPRFNGRNPRRKAAEMRKPVAFWVPLEDSIDVSSTSIPKFRSARYAVRKEYSNQDDNDVVPDDDDCSTISISDFSHLDHELEADEESNQMGEIDDKPTYGAILIHNEALKTVVEGLERDLESAQKESAQLMLEKRDALRAYIQLRNEFHSLEDKYDSLNFINRSSQGGSVVQELSKEDLAGLSLQDLRQLEDMSFKNLLRLRKEVQRRRASEARISSLGKCIACEDADANTVLLPCKHQVLCVSCADRVTCCPIDRRSIKESFETYR